MAKIRGKRHTVNKGAKDRRRCHPYAAQRPTTTASAQEERPLHRCKHESHPVTQIARPPWEAKDPQNAHTSPKAVQAKDAVFDP